VRRNAEKKRVRRDAWRRKKKRNVHN